MFSTKEIADYVHGQAATPEKQQFTFGKVKKIGESLTVRWPALAGITDDEPGPAGQIALAPKVKRVTAVIWRVRRRTLARIRAARRNILLLLLFILLSALMFVLESQQGPADRSRDNSRSGSTAAT
jgi:hypothetical protein